MSISPIPKLVLDLLEIQPILISVKVRTGIGTLIDLF